MKKVLGSVLFLFALSSLAYAEDDAAKVLDKMRDKIEKEVICQIVLIKKFRLTINIIKRIFLRIKILKRFSFLYN